MQQPRARKSSRTSPNSRSLQSWTLDASELTPIWAEIYVPKLKYSQPFRRYWRNEGKPPLAKVDAVEDRQSNAAIVLVSGTAKQTALELPLHPFRGLDEPSKKAVRAVSDDQIDRDGDRTVNLSLDCRNAWRPHLGRSKSGRRHYLQLHSSVCRAEKARADHECQHSSTMLWRGDKVDFRRWSIPLLMRCPCAPKPVLDGAAVGRCQRSMTPPQALLKEWLSAALIILPQSMSDSGQVTPFSNCSVNGSNGSEATDPDLVVCPLPRMSRPEADSRLPASHRRFAPKLVVRGLGGSARNRSFVQVVRF